MHWSVGWWVAAKIHELRSVPHSRRGARGWEGAEDITCRRHWANQRSRATRREAQLCLWTAPLERRETSRAVSEDSRLLSDLQPSETERSCFLALKKTFAPRPSIYHPWCSTFMHSCIHSFFFQRQMPYDSGKPKYTHGHCTGKKNAKKFKKIGNDALSINVL